VPAAAGGDERARGDSHLGGRVPRDHGTPEDRAHAADEVVAIEPFSSSGAGQVDGRRTGNIYRVLRTRSLKVPELNAFLSDLVVDFRTLPFAERWAYALDPKAPALLNQLLRVGAVMTYPALLDTGKGIVAQTEHTMIVRAGGAEVTTA